jgi:hypothetical protein
MCVFDFNDPIRANHPKLLWPLYAMLSTDIDRNPLFSDL